MLHKIIFSSCLFFLLTFQSFAQDKPEISPLKTSSKEDVIEPPDYPVFTLSIGASLRLFESTELRGIYTRVETELNVRTSSGFGSPILATTVALTMQLNPYLGISLESTPLGLSDPGSILFSELDLLSSYRFVSNQEFSVSAGSGISTQSIESKLGYSNSFTAGPYRSGILKEINISSERHYLIPLFVKFNLWFDKIPDSGLSLSASLKYFIDLSTNAYYNINQGNVNTSLNSRLNLSSFLFSLALNFGL